MRTFTDTAHARRYAQTYVAGPIGYRFSQAESAGYKLEDKLTMESSRQRSRSPRSESQRGTTDSPRPRSQSPLTESERRREDRLRKRRERERKSRASESAEEKEVRLRRRREREIGLGRLLRPWSRDKLDWDTQPVIGTPACSNSPRTDSEGWRVRRQSRGSHACSNSP